MTEANSTPEEQFLQVERCLTQAKMTLGSLRNTTDMPTWRTVLDASVFVEASLVACDRAREAIDGKPVEKPHPLYQAAVLAYGNLLITAKRTGDLDLASLVERLNMITSLFTRLLFQLVNEEAESPIPAPEPSFEFLSYVEDSVFGDGDEDQGDGE